MKTTLSLRFPPCWAIAALSLLTLHRPALGQVLYDAAIGTMPASQGWGYAAVGSASQTMTNNAVQLDSSAFTGTQAGYSRLAPTALSTLQGFSLLFTAQLPKEVHNNTNRSGFSVIVLDQNRRGLELAFWTNAIWAQNDSPLFVHGENATFSTTSFVDYSLTFHDTNYVLRANGTNILTGRVRDYTAFSGFPDPYETANFLFFGDDTTSASATVNLRKITLVSPPVLTKQLDRICWSGVSNLTYTVEVSTNLSDWDFSGTAVSFSADFCFTNDTLSSQQFFRVVYP